MSVGTATRRFAEFLGFAALLFVTRFVARGHLVPHSDQECHIGGIALDFLAHGIRFPLTVYAPNEYDNGSFFSGLLVAGSFSLLGRNVLALKLVTHLISAAGAVATLSLLRGCLKEVGLTTPRQRWAAVTVLVIALALAPRIVTLCSTYAVGNHAEGCAFDMLLLALFAARRRTWSAGRTGAYWALVGFALYVNKGTALVVPVLAAAEVLLSRPSPRRLAAAAAGFLLGLLPELSVVATQAGTGNMGWITMAAKGQRNASAFPHGFVEALLYLGERRVELLTAWALSLAFGTTLLARSACGDRRQAAADGAGTGLPLHLGLAVGVVLVQLAALTVMAQGGLDAYAIYGYPALAALLAVLVACVCDVAARRSGEGTASWVGAGAVILSLVLYRPDAVQWDFRTVAALWRNRNGAACSWRFAEGFERAYDYGLSPRTGTREQQTIEGCRSLSEEDQVLDCIGGIARELGWRHFEKLPPEPPAGLNSSERHAYAYYYGTHRKGAVAACGEFADPDLTSACTAAVLLECLAFADLFARLTTGARLGPPGCAVAEPPMDGYWAAIRRDLQSRKNGTGPAVTHLAGDVTLESCRWVFDQCY